MTNSVHVVRTTCPRDCYDACGISVTLEDGVVRRVDGDVSHPVNKGSLCGKCALAYNGVLLDSGERLLGPLKRAGRKGSGAFEAVTWERALEDIARRLGSVVAASGGESVLQTHYTGTCSAIAGSFPLRFFNRLGAVEVEPDTVCNNAGHVALAATLGHSSDGFDPLDGANAACLMIWGANPAHSAPHMHSQWIPGLACKTIVIDPIRHATARRADFHLQLRPGSDAALAFAFMHVAKAEGLLDREFIADCTTGFDLIELAIDEATPEWGERATGVPAATIVEAATLYAGGPSLLWLGQGMQRQRRGGNAFRAAAALAAATGNLGKPGAGLCYLNGPGTRGVDTDFLAGPELASGESRSISHMDLASHLEDPARSRALLTWNNNIVASSPEQARLRRALEREDLFTVVVDLFQTDTADYADYVLPAAGFLEFDDIVFPYFMNFMSAQAKVMEPLGESLPNQEIFRRLSRAMGFEEDALFESDDVLIERLIRQTSFEGTFDGLKARGTVSLLERPRVPFGDRVFPTPSGRIEIASEALAAKGAPLVPEPHFDALPPPDRLRLLSPASRWIMNSSYGNDEGVLKKIGEQEVLLNHADLEDRGIAEGDRVRLENELGALVLRATASDQVPAGVALAYKGYWPRHAAGGANVNLLNPGDKTDLGESSCVHAVEVRLRRHDGS